MTKPQIIKSKYFTIYLYDTSHKKQTYMRKYQQLLKKEASILDSWIRSKSKTKDLNIEFSITLCGERKIRSLNAQYRRKDKITDVLSFPLEDKPMNLLKKSKLMFPVLSLGDIFICKEVAMRQAKEFNLKAEEELIYLGVHGLLHLLGFDHEISRADEKKMQKEEDFITGKIL